MVRSGSIAPPWILVVSGPTASGKSALGLKLAKILGGEIVSLDSVQVFKGFNVGAAKPTPQELKEVPHHCIDILEPTETVNAGKISIEGDRAIAKVLAKERLPIVVAGTTLYLTSLLHGLAQLPEASIQMREHLRESPLADLYEELKAQDPVSAKRLHPNDRIRIERALEASMLGKEKYSDSLKAHQFESLKYNALILVLCWPRAKLYQRVNHRTEQMLENGLLNETKELLNLYGEKSQGLRSLGYAQGVKVLNGTLDIAKLGPEIAQSTRRFAKRQVTFWRNEPQKRGWISQPEQEKGSVGKEPADLLTDSLGLDRVLDLIRDSKESNKSQVCVRFLDMERLNQDLESA